MDSRGINYIETIIAFAIFVISVATLLSVFLQSGLNYRYSTDKYEAALLAESILEDVAALLPEASVDSAVSGYVPINDFLDGALTEYQNEDFGITLLIKRVRAADINFEMTEADIVVSTLLPPLDVTTQMNGLKLSASNSALFNTSGTMYAVMVVVMEADSNRSLCIMTDLVFD